MKILVVNPPNKPFTNKSIIAEPLDVLQLATIIEKNYQYVEVLDMDSNRLGNNINKYLDNENIVIFVYDYQLPLHTSATIDNIFEIIKTTRKRAKFIMVGKTSSYFSKKFLENGVDIVIKQIADETILKVLASITDNKNLIDIPNIAFKDKEKIIETSKVPTVNNFKSLPIPNRNLVPIESYMDTRTMITSRGCIGTCKFCTTPYFYGKWNGKEVNEIFNKKV